MVGYKLAWLASIVKTVGLVVWLIELNIVDVLNYLTCQQASGVDQKSMHNKMGGSVTHLA